MKRALPWPTLVAGGLAVLAGAVLARDALAPAPPIAVPADGGGAAPPPDAPLPVGGPPGAAYADMAARPVFFPGRRMPVVAAGAGAAAAPVLDFTLVGVVTGPGQTMALVQRPGQAQAVVVRVGSVVDGWTVSAITRSGIEVRAGGTSSALRIVQ